MKALFSSYLKRPISILFGLTLLIGCGGSDGGSSSTTTESRQVFIDLTTAKVGQKYAMVPYILGDPESINGKTSEAIGSFSFFSEGGTEVSLLKSSYKSPSPSSSGHYLRTMINRFQPESPGAIAKIHMNLGKDLSHGFASWSDNFFQQKKISMQMLNQTTACPNSFYILGQSSPIDTSSLTRRENVDYCLVYMSDTGVSEPDPDNVEASISKAISTYKTIFNTDFATTIDGYTFKPLIVVLPFDDTNYWPEEFSSLSGAFSAAMSKQNLVPTIYLASDQKLSGASSINEQDYFHSTLAHELFHAAFNYSRSWLKNDGEGDADTIAIDEGLAHLFEDALGYGPLNFAQFAGAFLQDFPSLTRDNSIAILDASDQDSLDDREQGAAQTFLYYLVSNKGGLTFEDGYVSGGDGLTFLQDFFESDGGVSGLAEAYGIDWGDTFEDYLASLSVNNSDFGTLTHDLQDLTTNKDLLGSESQYGMKFTAFEDIPSLGERLSELPTYESADPEMMTDVPLFYYESTPYIITITEENSRFSVIFDSFHENAGVSLIRVE